MHPNPSANSLPHLDYRWVALASLLLSAWLIALDPLINRDAIIYLRAADAYLQDGFTASQQHFGRPVLSICMAWIHQLTGIPLVYAGLAITTTFYALLCCAFVASVHTLGGDRRVQLIAAIVILSHPMINNDRSSIMRDPAYWTLLLLALREMLLYLRSPTLKHQLRWFTLVILASLFRFEGLFFAALAPLAVLFAKDLADKGRHCLHLLVPQLLAIGSLLLGALAYQSRLGPDATAFPSIQRYLDRLAAFPEQFQSAASAAAQPLLQFTALEDAPVAAIAALSALLLLNICRATTWVWTLTLLWGWRAHLLERFRRDDAILLRAHLLIALAYLAAFVLINRFMLERYSLQLVVFLLLLLPFVLSALWHAGGWRKVLVIVLLLGMSADTLHNGRGDKAFIRDATEWVRDNTPTDSIIVTNEKYIAYFSRRQADWSTLLGIKFDTEDILAHQRLWKNSDYMVMYLREGRQESWNEWLEQHSLQELRTFQSGRKGKVVVVALPH